MTDTELDNSGGHERPKSNPPEPPSEIPIDLVKSYPICGAKKLIRRKDPALDVSAPHAPARPFCPPPARAGHHDESGTGSATTTPKRRRTHRQRAGRLARRTVAGVTGSASSLACPSSRADEIDTNWPL